MRYLLRKLPVFWRRALSLIVVGLLALFVWHEALTTLESGEVIVGKRGIADPTVLWVLAALFLAISAFRATGLLKQENKEQGTANLVWIALAAASLATLGFGTGMAAYAQGLALEQMELA